MSMAEAIVACSQHSESRGCIGDVSCNWNARSPYIRCAMNPGGECQGCKDYEGA
ncbi:MAG: DUF6464 family protein [Nostoc sp.]|uniref:DUF6464 family protein n=1 Tax=Nostoc sp. TaxID=1180 RepID=UPI002FF61BC7